MYTSAHPEKYQALLKYMHIVRIGASRINGLGWKTYDEQFRLKMGIDPVKSWEIVDQELWLLYMGNTRNSLPNSYKNDKSKTSVNNVTISTKWECATESPVTTNMCVSVVLDITLIIHVRIEIHMKM